VILIPLFSAVLLIINPALLVIYRKLEINIQKYQFWVLVTTGTAWIFSLVFFFLRPEKSPQLGWNDAFPFLPGPVFRLDWISSSLVLGICAITFFAVLSQLFSPLQTAWFSGFSGVCLIALLADSAYTLMFTWTLIELILLFRTINKKNHFEPNRRSFLAILFRLGSPLLLIFATLVSTGAGTELFISDFQAKAGPYVVLAGAIALVGWFDFFKSERDTARKAVPGNLSEFLPASLGLMLLIRGAAMVVGNTPNPLILTLAALGLLIICVFGILLDIPKKTWLVGCLGLIIFSALTAGSEVTLSWGMVFLLPGFLLSTEFKEKKQAILALVIGSIGILPLPFFPAWGGTDFFQGGIGILFAVSAGVILAGIVKHNLRKFKEKQFQSNENPLLLIIGSAVLLVSQLAIALSIDLLGSSKTFLSRPFAAWIPVPLVILFSIWGDRVPKLKSINLERIKLRIVNTTKIVLMVGTDFVERIISLLTRLFEGEGGLIWALLIGFLIISLISIK